MDSLSNDYRSKTTNELEKIKQDIEAELNQRVKDCALHESLGEIAMEILRQNAHGIPNVFTKETLGRTLINLYLKEDIKVVATTHQMYVNDQAVKQGEK